ncbi:hypothetical protein PC129_g13756 [Phytophthora cactorum]|uniref:Uncharacterized protein n=1 Tax=Phytophthora cactorum TaxID=29920 RepID=A0A8T1HSV0_9STRA|nr:hypothetical protein PC114_g17150 [Phytophthora cactorum]KAG3215353.1 hypothetical protein PC129_g13756 [Phytophthora cactorum]
MDQPLKLKSDDEADIEEDKEQGRQRTRQEIQAEYASLMVVAVAATTQVAAVLEEVDLLQGQFIWFPTTNAAMMDQGEQTVSLSEGLQQKGLKQVAMPCTGNCPVYAVVQALAGITFVEYSGQLVELSRGWDKMANNASAEEFRNYFQEYGSSLSAIMDLLEDRIWGSNDILATYGMLLQRAILAISLNVDGSGWGAIHYQPDTVRGAKGVSNMWHAVKTGKELSRTEAPVLLFCTTQGITMQRTYTDVERETFQMKMWI